MSRPTRWALWLAVAAPLAGCALSDEAMFQTFTGEGPATEAEMEVAEVVRGLGGPVPALQSARFRPPPISPGPTSDSPAGNRIAQLRAEAVDLQRALGRRDEELQFLRRAYRIHAEQYVLALAEMELVAGEPLPAGDASFRADLSAARSALSQMQGDLLKMNSLAAQVAVDSANGNQLIQLARELAARTGTAAADRAALSRLERELNATVETAHRLLASLHGDIGTQTEYAARQRVHLQELAARLGDGGEGPIEPVTAAPPDVPEAPAPGDAPAVEDDGPSDPAAAPQGEAGLAGRNPFVTIRFDRPEVAYEWPLYTAVKAALERKPDARFDLVAVPRAGDAGAAADADARAEEVLAALTRMGLPASRVTQTTATAQTAADPEVRLYVR